MSGNRDHDLVAWLAGCHMIRAYQDGVYLGESYYAGHLFPEE